jgi:hypothetical protein
MNETISILINGEATGIKNVIQDVMKSFTGMVDALNGQTINWGEILTGAFDASVVSALALVFGAAIEQAIAMSNILSNVGNLTPTTTGNTAAIAGTAGAIDLVNQVVQDTGASMGDATTAVDDFANGVTASNVVLAEAEGAIQLMKVSGDSLSSILPNLQTLLQDWGITTVEGVTTAINGLVNANKQGTISMTDLISTLGKATVSAQVGQSIGGLAIQMQELTKDIPSADVISATEQILTLAGQKDSVGANLLKIQDGLVGPNGLTTAFETVTTLASGMFAGIPGQLSTITGISIPAIEQIGKVTAAQYTVIGAAVSTVNANLQSTPGIVNSNQSAWQKLIDQVNIFLKNIGTVAMPILNAFFDVLTLGLKAVNLEFTLLGDLFSDLAKVGGVITSIVGSLAKLITPELEKIFGVTPAPATSSNSNTTNNSQVTTLSVGTLNVTGGTSSSSTGKAIGNAALQHLNKSSYGSQ